MLHGILAFEVGMRCHNSTFRQRMPVGRGGGTGQRDPSLGDIWLPNSERIILHCSKRNEAFPGKPSTEWDISSLPVPSPTGPVWNRPRCQLRAVSESELSFIKINGFVVIEKAPNTTDFCEPGQNLGLTVPWGERGFLFHIIALLTVKPKEGFHQPQVFRSWRISWNGTSL